MNVLLKLQVQMEVDVVSRLGGAGRLPLKGAHDASHGVHLGEADPVDPLEALLVLPLEADLPHDHPLLVPLEAGRLQLAGRDLAHVTENVAQRWTPDVPPPRPHLEKDPRELGPELLQHGELLVGEVHLDQEGLAPVPAEGLRQRLHPILREGQDGL